MDSRIKRTLSETHLINVRTVFRGKERTYQKAARVEVVRALDRGRSESHDNPK